MSVPRRLITGFTTRKTSGQGQGQTANEKM